MVLLVAYQCLGRFRLRVCSLLRLRRVRHRANQRTISPVFLPIDDSSVNPACPDQSTRNLRQAEWTKLLLLPLEASQQVGEMYGEYCRPGQVVLMLANMRLVRYFVI